jgi:hypothetical protein
MTSYQASVATNVYFDFNGKKALVKAAPVRKTGHRDALERWVTVESVENNDIEVYRVNEDGLEEFAGTLAQQSPLFRAVAINRFYEATHKVANA